LQKDKEHFMNRLRRVRRESSPFPIAADVLEVRALLSGAAAVHSAAQHALAVAHAPAAGKITSTGYQVTVQIPDLLSVNNPPVQGPGSLAITPVSTTVGSHVQVRVTAALTVDTIPALLTVSLKGKVLSSSSNGSTTTVHLAPSGTFKFTSTISGHVKTISIHAIAPMTITLDNTGTFTALETEFNLPPIHGTPRPPFDFLAYTA
jgi:hypothetical protein